MPYRRFPSRLRRDGFFKHRFLEGSYMMMYPDSILEQFLYESEEWSRLLAFLKQENIFYKSRLAEVVNTTDNKEMITVAEKFNEDFLSQDKIIEFLTDELKSQSKLLQKDVHAGGESLEDAIRHQKKLRADVEKAEKIFHRIKKNYSGFLNNLP